MSDTGILKARLLRVRENANPHGYVGAVNDLEFILSRLQNEGLERSMRPVRRLFNRIENREGLAYTLDNELEQLIAGIQSVANECEPFVVVVVQEVQLPAAQAVSDPRVLQIMALLSGMDNTKAFGEEQLAELWRMKDELHRHLFAALESKVEASEEGRRNLPGLLFDRLLTSTELGRSDAEEIARIRANSRYTADQRALVVSGLTLSAIGSFDLKKVHLLIDLVTDFEEGVWQKALVGLLLCLLRYDNAVSSYKDVRQRLMELRQIKRVQQGILIIDRVLHYRSFSLKDSFLQDPESYRDMYLSILPSNLEIDRSDLENFQRLFGDDSSQELSDRLIAAMIRPEALRALLESVGDRTTISAEEMFAILDVERYLELHELNPFMLNLESPIHSVPRNWFTPFAVSDDMRRMLINNPAMKEVDVDWFLQLLAGSNSVIDPDKYGVVYALKDADKEFVEMFVLGLALSEHLLSKRGVKDFWQYTRIMKELYRFQRLFGQAENQSLFLAPLEMHEKRLLESVADATTQERIKARVLIDRSQYMEAGAILTANPEHERTLDGLDMIVTCMVGQKDSAKVIEYATKALALNASEGGGVERETRMVWRLKVAHTNLKEYDKAFGMLLREIELREQVLTNLREKDELPKEIHEQAILVASCFFEAAVASWNLFERIVPAVAYFLRFFELLRSVPAEVLAQREDRFESQRTSFATTMNILLKHDDHDSLLAEAMAQADNLKHAGLRATFTGFFATLRNMEGREQADETENDLIEAHLHDLYERALPVVQSVIETEGGKYENIVIPFEVTSAEWTAQVVFPLKGFVEEGPSIILSKLSEPVVLHVLNKYVQGFTDKLFDSIVRGEDLEQADEWQALRAEVLSILRLIDLPKPQSTASK